jgi:hypothetical protein
MRGEMIHSGLSESNSLVGHMGNVGLGIQLLILMLSNVKMPADLEKSAEFGQPIKKYRGKGP